MNSDSNTETFVDILKALVSAAFTAGVTVGFVEAALVVFHVIANNSINVSLFRDVIVFISINVLIFAAAMVTANLLGSPFFSLIYKLFFSRFTTLNMHRFALAVSFFVAVIFTLGYWFNYNTGRSLQSGKSILFNALALTGAAFVAFLVYRLSVRRSMKIKLLKHRRPHPVFAAWSLVLLVALFMNSSVKAQRTAAKPNVILLIVDTLRPDRLRCYGYDKNTSPAIDKIAAESVLFEQAYVQWASSLPSHSSIMTSMQPYLHGAFPNGKSLNPELQTLPKILKAYGYKNGAFVSNTLVGNQYNFALGYDTFTDLTHFDYRNTSWPTWLRALNWVRLYDKLAGNDLFTQLALSWITTHQQSPFFLWAQWLFPHAPYEAPDKFLNRFEDSYSGPADGSLDQIYHVRKGKVVLNDADKAHYEALYDAEVARSDFEIELIVTKLNDLGLLDNSILIITSDHGENLFEHDMEYGHSGVYDSSVRIPLILRFPPSLKAGTRVPRVVQSIDIAPTVLQLLDLPVPDQFQGRSLVSLANGQDANWPSMAYSVMFREWRNFFGLRKDEWKIILDVRKDHQSLELYHLPTDPSEVDNRYETEPEVAATMKKELDNWLSRDFSDINLVYEPGNFFKEDFDEQTKERLRSLGYLK